MHKILVILGPTATGKSSLAVEMAQKFNGEIISADSRQVYIGLDIGTGKITPEEMGAVPHYLIDVVNPNEEFGVSTFKKLAEEKIEDILVRGKLPIIVGGTGFYIQAIVDGLILPEVPPNKELREELEKQTEDELFNELERIDPERAENIGRGNKRRIIRAIEIVRFLGKVPKLVKSPKYESLQIGLDLSDEKLKERINERLLKRIVDGMIEEAQNLNKKGLSLEKMINLGLEYKYLAFLMQGKMTREKMVEDLKKEIWYYAKRQRTWFRKDKRIKWFGLNQTGQIDKEIINFLK